MREFRPDEIYIAAATVGGIYANKTFPGDFIIGNLLINTNIIYSAFKNDVKKLLMLGSSCIYPKLAEQPMKEEALISGYLEPTNEPYAVAKIAGIKLCESLNRQFYSSNSTDYRAVMPTNLYGPGDNYHELNSHVIPGLIRRIHEAKMKKVPVLLFGVRGKSMREFLHVDDLARACVHIMNLSKEKYDSVTLPMRYYLNAGSGEEISIKNLAKKIVSTVDYQGDLVFDQTKPDGSPRKLIDSQRLVSTGWKPNIKLEEGLKRTYEDYLENQANLNVRDI